MKRLFLDTAAGWAGNPSSLHQEGVEARSDLESARGEVAQVLGAHSDEIVFTSGGTESNNLAFFGLSPGEVVVSAIEHSSVLASAKRREESGQGKMIIFPVDENGLVNLDQFKKFLNPKTILVSVMYANNEIGTIQPIAEVAKMIRQARKKFGQPTPYLHVDACQASRFLPLNVQKLGVDLMTLNSSKINSPRGVGVLFVRRGVSLKPLIVGGGQEGGRRAGTENNELITKFAKALVLAQKHKDKINKKLLLLRDYFIKEVFKNISGTSINGSEKERLPNNINLSFEGVLGEQVVLELDARGIAASTGSACAIPDNDDSYVIMALGRTKTEARRSVRFSLPNDISKSEIKHVVKTLKTIITNLRNANHVYTSNLAL